MLRNIMLSDIIECMKTKDYDALYDSLKHAAELYYNGEASPLTDAEYDDGVRELHSIALNDDKYDGRWDDLFDTSVNAGSSIDNDDIVKHAIPMQSLAKAYDLNEIDSYVKRLIAAGADGFRFQMKLDGQSMSAMYSHGRLIQLSTRGNGMEGKDISHLIDNTDVDIENLPLKLLGARGHEIDDISDELEIRGELLLTFTHYHEASAAREKATGEPFSVYRNAGIGIVNKAKDGLGYHATLTFISYRVIKNGEPDDTDGMMRTLESYGFMTVDTATENAWRAANTNVPGLVIRFDGKHAQKAVSGASSGTYDSIDDMLNAMHAVIEQYGVVRGGFDIPNDGIVIKPLNEDAMNDKLGYTAHHPVSQIAFKYASEQYEVTAREIKWTVGKQGHLTPTLIYDPIDLDGVRNDRATFHNAAFVRDYDIRPGSICLVHRAGEVIPTFDDVKSTNVDTERFAMPENCPKCGTKIVFDGNRIAICPNMDCPGRKEYILYAAVGMNALNIKGMGEAIIDAGLETGLITGIPSLFKLDVDSLSALQTEGHKVGDAAITIMNEINKARNASFPRVCAALAIPGIGMRTASIMESHGIRSIRELSAASRETLLNIPGIGAVTACTIINWFHNENNMNTINELDDAGVKAISHADETNAVNDSKNVSNDPFIDGKSFSITGDVPVPFKNRNMFRDYIESNGGRFNPAPNKNTDYVIGDETSPSSKMVKALEYRDKQHTGVIIMTPAEFTESMRK